MNNDDTPFIPPSESDSSGILQEELKTKALDYIKAALKGNGVKLDDVALKSYDDKALEFLATTRLIPDFKISITRKAGKLTTAQLVPSANQFNEAVNKEIIKITRSADVIKRIKASVFERPDKGIAVSREIMKFKYLNKDFIAHEECTQCRAQGKVPCNKCGGKGAMPCPRCHGRGSETCPTCSGRQYIAGPNGQQQHCQRCNGSGRTACSQCHEHKTVQCRQCGATGTMQCSHCNGHAWISAIASAEINLIADYDFDRERLEEKAIKAIEALGSDIQDHAFIGIVDRPKDQEKEAPHIDIDYHIKAPSADCVFKIKEDMDIPAYMFGKQGQLFHTPDFIEDIAKNGIQCLQNAGQGRGDTAENIRKAGRYKTLRHIILAALKLPLDKAEKVVLKNNPIGLSAATTKQLLTDADKALKTITHKPRIFGTILGAGLAGVGFYAYFMILRLHVLTAFKNNIAGNIADLLILILGCALSIYVIKAMAGHALNKALSVVLRGKNKPSKTAKAGNAAYTAIALTILAFAASAYATTQTAAPIPQWLKLILS